MNPYTIVKFGLIGALTAALYFLVMSVAYSWLQIRYIAAVSIAYFASTSFHFLANRHFTFQAAHDSHQAQLARYLVLWLANYCITLAVVRVSVQHFFLSPYLGICISIACTSVFGYVVASNWVFKGREG